MSVQSCKSAERVFQVLALFREHKQPMRASFISRQLDYPLSSCVVLLKAIMRMGYLSFDAKTRTFFPTDNIYHLGSWLMNERVADPKLVDLARAVHDHTGNSVTFSIRHDADLEFVFSLNAGLPLNNVYVGARMPLSGCVAGVAYLSGLGEAEAAGIIDRMFTKAASGADARLAIRARVQRARQVGYACGPSPRFPGLLAFAKCIRSRVTGQQIVVCIGSTTRDVAVFEDDTRRELGGRLQTYLER
jgi:DNA-binding IclR family transcriptional regulator